MSDNTQNNLQKENENNFSIDFAGLKKAAEALSSLDTKQKNGALLAVKNAILENTDTILNANKADIQNAKAALTSAPLIDRLMLNSSRLQALANSIEKVVKLPDPIGKVLDGWTTSSGLEIKKVQVSLGVVAVIYESRPNVTVDTFALTFKSSNAVLLRGSASAYNTNFALVAVIKTALKKYFDSDGAKSAEKNKADSTAINNNEASKNSESADGYTDKNKTDNSTLKVAAPNNPLEKNMDTAKNKAAGENSETLGTLLSRCVQLVKVTPGSHSDVEDILCARGKIDVAVPRGSARLINFVVQNAKIPVIETGAGVCHLFIDKSADESMALNISKNAKMQRPGVCNAVECILVHKDIAQSFLPKLAELFCGKVTIHADEESYKTFCSCGAVEKAALTDKPHPIIEATAQDEGFEYLDYEVLIKTVLSLEAAITYINTHNTHHSEAIITNDYKNAKAFQNAIDAACVYVNASTRFTDGEEFGFGCELGISTQKLHARGPMGLQALTSTKYLIDGKGQVRE